MSGLMDIFAHLEQEGVQLSSIINGAAVKSPLPAMPKINPATGTVIASIEPASPEMLDDAVRYAAAAQKDWAARAAHERAEILSHVARLITEHVDVLSRLEVLDVGKLYS